MSGALDWFDVPRPTPRPEPEPVLVLVWIPDPVTGMRHASLVPADKAAGLERVKV